MLTSVPDISRSEEDSTKTTNTSREASLDRTFISFSFYFSSHWISVMLLKYARQHSWGKIQDLQLNTHLVLNAANVVVLQNSRPLVDYFSWFSQSNAGFVPLPLRLSMLNLKDCKYFNTRDYSLAAIIKVIYPANLPNRHLVNSTNYSSLYPKRKIQGLMLYERQYITCKALEFNDINSCLSEPAPGIAQWYYS